jgi:hypothetical protein
MKKGIFHSLIVTILLLFPIAIVVTASQADLIKTDFLPLLVKFEYFTESSISKFNDFIALIASFAIAIHDQDYQLAKEKDYASLLAEFIYSLTDPNTITTIAKTTTSMHIASDFNAEEQESITTIRYSLLDISISVDTVVVKEGEVEKGDNNQW